VTDESPVYVQMNRKIWNTAQFRGLSRDARELFFYLTTCPHGNMLGIFVLRPGYAIDDLQWGSDRERFAKSLAELLTKGLFKHDPVNDVILDMEHIVKHPPINGHVATAAIKIVNSLPKTPLFYDLKLLVESLGKSYLESLAISLSNRFAIPVTVTETVSVTAEGGVGETEAPKHLPVDNSEPQPSAPIDDEDQPPPSDTPPERGSIDQTAKTEGFIPKPAV